LLKDHVFTLAAYVHAFNRTRKLEYKARAELVAKALEKFYDKRDGGFYDTLYDKSAIGFLKDRLKPVEENAYAAIVLRELYSFTKKDKYLKMAVKSLEAITPEARRMGPYAATYAIASSEFSAKQLKKK